MIAIGSDHGGFELKNQVKDYLIEKGYEVKDFGCTTGETIDYPDVANEVCSKVVNKEAELGILFCGTGIGISMAANKIKGIRAALACDTYSARMARMHNNANVLCLGGRTMGQFVALDIVDNFLNAKFDGGRHQMRINKIMDLEK